MAKLAEDLRGLVHDVAIDLTSLGVSPEPKGPALEHEGPRGVEESGKRWSQQSVADDLKKIAREWNRVATAAACQHGLRVDAFLEDLHELGREEPLLKLVLKVERVEVL